MMLCRIGVTWPFTHFRGLGTGRGGERPERKREGRRGHLETHLGLASG